MIQRDVAPHVDFGIWGPNHHRLMKKLRIKGIVLATTGAVQETELAGPPTLEHWMECWQIFATAMLGFHAMTLGTTLDYAALMEEYHSRYGSVIWAVLYQADVRFRLEHLERIRRTLDLQNAEARAANVLPTFKLSKEMPWDSCFQFGMKDAGFWKREFEEPALLVVTKSRSANDLVAGDAPLAGKASATASNPDAHQYHDEPAPKRQKKSGVIKQVKDTHKVVGGKFTHNRANYPVCLGFQLGQCQPAKNGWCPKHN